MENGVTNHNSNIIELNERRRFLMQMYKASSQRRPVVRKDWTVSLIPEQFVASPPPDGLNTAPVSRQASRAGTVLSYETLEVLNTLNAEHKQLLKETFAAMYEEPARTGHTIFIKMFQDYPQYKNIFPRFKTVNDSALFGAPELRAHGEVYMAGLKLIIDQLDDEEVILFRELKVIAKTHLVKGIRKFHVQNQLESMLDTVRECNGGAPLSPQVKHAWKTLFDVIAALIEEFKAQELSQRHDPTHLGVIRE